MSKALAALVEKEAARIGMNPGALLKTFGPGNGNFYAWRKGAWSASPDMEKMVRSKLAAMESRTEELQGRSPETAVPWLEQQARKGLTVHRCGECADRFWINKETLASLLSRDKNPICRDCQIEHGFQVPPYPCARKLNGREIEETEGLADDEQRNALARTYVGTKDMNQDHGGSDDKGIPEHIMQNRMSLKAIAEKLEYYFDVTGDKKGAFCDAAGISRPALSYVMKGKKVRNRTRFAVLREMEKRGWLGTQEEKKKEETPKREAVTTERPALSESERRFIIYSIYNARIIIPREERDAIIDKILSAFPS